ncbi:unnamed protein product, partial [Gongylonema pulchrum]|uniref:SIR2_2 domain-containing protein n=1 Tax=Gongylonema pulchrum TaxID=637853 RepID=A0A183DDD7_9BILA
YSKSPRRFAGTANNGSSRGNNRKRKQGDQNPNAIISPNYSLEVLMSTDFPQNMEIGELARRIAEALGERDAKFMTSELLKLDSVWFLHYLNTVAVHRHERLREKEQDMLLTLLTAKGRHVFVYGSLGELNDIRSAS